MSAMNSSTQSFQAATSLHEADDRQSAESSYRDALRVDAADADPTRGLARLLLEQNRLEEAESQYRNLYDHDPNDFEALFQLGLIAAHRKQKSQAVEFLRKTLDVAPKHEEVLSVIGNTLAELGDLKTAVRCFEIVLQIEPANFEIAYNLGFAHYQRAEYEKALEVFQRLQNLQPKNLDVLCIMARSCERLQRFDEAERYFTQAVNLDARSVAAIFGKARCAEKHDDIPQAIDLLRQGLSIDSSRQREWIELSRLLELQNDGPSAIEVLQNSLKIDGDCFPVLLAMGDLFRREGQPKEAVESYSRAVIVDASNALARYSLGRAYQESLQLEKAEKTFREVLEIEPRHLLANFHLATVLKDCRRLDEALERFDFTIELAPTLAATHRERGNTLSWMGREEEACESFRKSLELNPDEPATWISYGNDLKTMDDLELAAECYSRVLNLLPQKTLWELWVATLCPGVFESNEAIDRYRSQLQSKLDRIGEKELDLAVEEIATYTCPVPYNLQFHARDDRRLKESYAAIFQNRFSLSQPPLNFGKPLLGIVVTQGHEGVFIRFMSGILQGFSHKEFETVIFCASSGEERIRRELPNAGFRTVVVPTSVDRMAQAIRESCCDVIYYWEIGSDVTNYFLPFFRLAKVQCTSVGVPVTTGNPNVDYFLSTDSLEIENAENHYTEKLIRAKTLLNSQDRLLPTEKLKPREEFGFGFDQNLYFCPHKIPKFHPDLDPIFAEILRRDGAAIIVIPSDMKGYLARKLSARLEKSMPDVFERIAIVPHLTLPDYLSLTKAADVILDPIYYGGGLTAYDGFSLNKAIVTMPTTFLRGRFASGFYNMMGIDDCIANSPEEYAAIAVKVGTNRDYRMHIEHAISQRSDVLFRSCLAIEEHEELFVRFIEEARRK